MLNRIDLDGNPGQTFSIVVNGRRVRFLFRYNHLMQRFWFDLYEDGVQLIAGRVLVSGVDLLKAYKAVAERYGRLFVVDIDDQGREPTLENIASGDVRVFLELPE